MTCISFVFVCMKIDDFQKPDIFTVHFPRNTVIQIVFAVYGMRFLYQKYILFQYLSSDIDG